MFPKARRYIFWWWYQWRRKIQMQDRKIRLPEEIIAERDKTHAEWIAEDRKVGRSQAVVDKLKYKEEILNWVLK